MSNITKKNQVYKKDRMVAKALLGAFSHVCVSLNIKQIEIFKMADIGKRIQRENYLPWISSEHKANIEEVPKEKNGGKNYLPWIGINHKDNKEFLKGEKAGNYLPWFTIDYSDKGREVPNKKMAGNNLP